MVSGNLTSDHRANSFHGSLESNLDLGFFCPRIQTIYIYVYIYTYK